MISLITNTVKTNMRLVLVKLFIVRTIICVTVQTYTTYKTIITTMTTRSLFLSGYDLFASNAFHTTIRYSVPNLFVSTYLLDLYSEELQTVLFISNASSYKDDWILTINVACLVKLIYIHTFSVCDGSWSGITFRLLDNSFAVTLLFV